MTWLKYEFEKKKENKFQKHEQESQTVFLLLASKIHNTCIFSICNTDDKVGIYKKFCFWGFYRSLDWHISQT